MALRIPNALQTQDMSVILPFLDYNMDSLSEFGSFACYFNAIAKSVELTLSRFENAPLFSSICIISAAVLSVLTSKLLIKTIDLLFSEAIHTEHQAILITRPPRERRSVINLPSLLQSSIPLDNWKDKTLYAVFLMIVLVSMVRFSMHSGRGIYYYFEQTAEMGFGGLMILFVAGILMSAYLSLQSMEGVHMAGVFLNIAFLVCYALKKSYRKEENYEEDFADFPTFVRCVCYPVLNPTIMAASRISSQRQSELQTWAVCAATGLHLVLGLFMRVFNPEINPEAVNAFGKCCSLLIIPCIFVRGHLRFRALADTIIAWRYGMDPRISQRKYRKRVLAVRIFLPAIVCLPYFCKHN